MALSLVKVVKGFASFWKDLVLLVLGIYLALSMENTVQDWENRDRESDYLYRLSLDMKTDGDKIRAILKAQEDKIAGLTAGVIRMQERPFDLEQESDQHELLALSELVNNYHFFSPQDYTFLSMRESGDFKLLRDEKVKSVLLKIHGNYAVLEKLQANYMQGLDAEFIPLWIRSVDLLNNEIYDSTRLEGPLFWNMVAFALNETTMRHDFLQRTLRMVEETERKLIAARSDS